MSKVELHLNKELKQKAQFSFHVNENHMKVFDKICKDSNISRGKLLENMIDLVIAKKVVIK